MLKKEFKNLLFIDTETTGLEEEDKIFQVAYDFEEKEYSELFNPGISISTEAMEVTHVTNKNIENKPCFKGSSMEKHLKEIFKNEKNILIAHNAKFDVKMLEKEDLEIGKIIDTWKISHFLDSSSKLKAYRLQFLRYELNLEVDDAQAHDALGDIRVLKALFIRLHQKMLKDLTHEEVLKKMIEISSNPIEIKKINFGKHAGKMLSDVIKEDKRYLEWLFREKKKEASNGNIDEDWIFTLKKYL